MKKYVCDVCGYIYDEEIGDPDNGVEAGTKWEDVPEDFLCIALDKNFEELFYF